MAEKDNIFIISTGPGTAEAIARYVSDHYDIESHAAVADQVWEDVFVYAIEKGPAEDAPKESGA
jgi:arginine repressor